MDSQIVSSKVAELKGIPTQEELLIQLKEELYLFPEVSTKFVKLL